MKKYSIKKKYPMSLKKTFIRPNPLSNLLWISLTIGRHSFSLVPIGYLRNKNQKKSPFASPLFNHVSRSSSLVDKFWWENPLKYLNIFASQDIDIFSSTKNLQGSLDVANSLNFYNFFIDLI